MLSEKKKILFQPPRKCSLKLERLHVGSGVLPRIQCVQEQWERDDCCAAANMQRSGARSAHTNTHTHTHHSDGVPSLMTLLIVIHGEKIFI